MSAHPGNSVSRCCEASPDTAGGGVYLRCCQQPQGVVPPALKWKHCAQELMDGCSRRMQSRLMYVWTGGAIGRGSSHGQWEAVGSSPGRAGPPGCEDRHRGEAASLRLPGLPLPAPGSCPQLLHGDRRMGRLPLGLHRLAILTAAWAGVNYPKYGDCWLQHALCP